MWDFRYGNGIGGGGASMLHPVQEHAGGYRRKIFFLLGTSYFAQALSATCGVRRARAKGKFQV